MRWQKKKVLVTGGGGFLGRYIVESLISLNCSSISSLGRSPQPDLTADGVNVVCADIADKEKVLQATENIDVIFHTAAKAGVWGSFKDFYDTNVKGTENIIEACRQNDISILINTSSPSVVSTDKDIENGDENIPYPENYLAYYPQTKAEAEMLISNAAQEGLNTISLRPHLIWGPRDPHILPRLFSKAETGRLRQVGDGRNKVDITYVENAASAHLKAAEALDENPGLTGKNYFISDDNPVLLWPWINDLLMKLNIPPVKKKISYKKARYIGFAMELFFKYLCLPIEPPMTRFVASQLAHSHFFNISAAKKDLGYLPAISAEKALEKTVEFFAKQT